MEARKELRPKQPRGTPRPGSPPPEDHTEPDVAEQGDSMADGIAVYLAYDLTKMRAFLAFRAREAKRDHQIMDIWVIDTKIMIKDNHPRICLKRHQVLRGCSGDEYTLISFIDDITNSKYMYIGCIVLCYACRCSGAKNVGLYADPLMTNIPCWLDIFHLLMA